MSADILRHHGRKPLHRLRMRNQRMPRLSQRIALRRTVEELGAEGLLQARDPPADRRRIKPEHPACIHEAVLACEREKHAQIVPFHSAILHGLPIAQACCHANLQNVFVHFWPAKARQTR